MSNFHTPLPCDVTYVSKEDSDKFARAKQDTLTHFDSWKCEITGRSGFCSAGTKFFSEVIGALKNGIPEGQSVEVWGEWRSFQVESDGTVRLTTTADDYNL